MDNQISRKELLRYLRVSPDVLDRLIRDGQITAHKAPGRKKSHFLKDEIESWVASLHGDHDGAEELDVYSKLREGRLLCRIYRHRPTFQDKMLSKSVSETYGKLINNKPAPYRK